MAEQTGLSDLCGEDTELAQEVIQLLVAMGGRLGQHFAARAAEFGLSMAEGKVLLALEPGDPVPMRVLARKLNYDASNLTGVVDRLENRGRVERRTSPGDRRIKAIALTAAGLRVRDDLWRRLRSDGGPVDTLTDTQLRDLRRLLRLALDDGGKH
ncbi:MAG: MarR family transcriptional regulator [Kutzneria sp.]|nr:MarR family transcriptional regulator [Kutzneria sp.]MBV9845464.1 MarR family transcriptional regulator [Kutzneria sp.]